MKKVNVAKPGLRIMKTVVSVLIVMILSTLSNGLLNSYDMVVVAILAIQADVTKSFNEIKKRIASTIIGGIIGTITMCIMYIAKSDLVNVILIPLGIFLILYLCSKLINKKEYIIIAYYVFLAITLDEAPEIGWIYPMRVMINTIIASIVAMVVNLYNPKRKSKVSIVEEDTQE